jgi:beta-N-acetylhexosaminidase
LNDKMVFISDSRAAQQCSTCTTYPSLGVQDLQSSIVRLYGPQAGGQITVRNLSSYSLTDLELLLDDELSNPALGESLNSANWIVFAMLNARDDIPSFRTLNRFLNERPDLLQQKRLIVFAFCAPYYLDATTISKLTAYFGLYSKTPQFIDVAAYLLFKELQPNGASPVSISGISYNLSEALFPDPLVAFPIELELAEPAPAETTITPSPAPLPAFKLGDLLPVRAGIINDYNGNPVPDGTPVTFIFSLGNESTAVRQEATTESGIARTVYAISNPGSLEIRAESENARSVSLKLEIPAPGEEVPTAIPTELPTLIPSPTPTTPLIPGVTPEPPSRKHPSVGDWFLALFLSGFLSLGVYYLTSWFGFKKSRIKTFLSTCVGGLLVYCIAALSLPENQVISSGAVSTRIILGSLAGNMIGLLVGILWSYFSQVRLLPHQKDEKG